MLSVRELGQSFGDRTILQNLNLTLLSGERGALVGNNGAGKSTLLKILFGQYPLEDGKIDVAGRRRIDYLSQEAQLPLEASAVEVVRGGAQALKEAADRHGALCLQMEKITDEVELSRIGEEVAELAHRLEAWGGFDIDHRVEEVLTRLGVKARLEKIKDLSGGEGRRVDLARLFLSGADILLLDEPTNHLDHQAVMFLAETLKNHIGAVLFVSHDRAFVDAVATKIFELEDGRIVTHPVPYEAYLKNRLTRLETEKRQAHRRAPGAHGPPRPY